MFHAILNAIIVARAKLKSVSDVYDCIFLMCFLIQEKFGGNNKQCIFS